MNHPVNLFTGVESVQEAMDQDQAHPLLPLSTLQVVLAQTCLTHTAPQLLLIHMVHHLVAQSVLEVMQVETPMDHQCQVQFPLIHLLLIHMAHQQHLQ